MKKIILLLAFITLMSCIAKAEEVGKQPLYEVKTQSLLVVNHYVKVCTDFYYCGIEKMKTWAGSCEKYIYEKLSDKLIDLETLPTAARQFVKQYFSELKILYITMERELTSTEYEIVFEDGTQIEFRGNGDWKEISNKSKCITTIVLPQTIVEFLQQRHSDQCVSEMSKEWHKFEIELNNGIEIVFNREGEFLHYDD